MKCFGTWKIYAEGKLADLPDEVRLEWAKAIVNGVVPDDVEMFVFRTDSAPHYTWVRATANPKDYM